MAWTRLGLMPTTEAIERPKGTFPAPLTTVSKEAVRALSMAGMGDQEILKRFPDLKDVTLRQWRFRDPIWSAVYDKNNRPGRSLTEKRADMENTVTAVTNAVSDSLESIHAGTALALAKSTAAALGKFAQAPAPLESWSDASTAYKMQRLACGIDKEGAQVQVNMTMFQAEDETGEGPIWEAEEAGSDQ